MLAMQLDIFPEATMEEIKQTKSLLSKYRKYKALVVELEREGIDNLAPKKQRAYNVAQRATQSIDRAVRLILDHEVRQIIEMRYIKGERHKVTVLYFGNMHPATVDRKINEGIRAVANTIKLIE